VKALNEYQKQKDYLICVDSDGCAMDTMDIKHFRCFGPCMVTEWDLEEWETPILDRWNEVNLYTMTRGINRFKGLAIALKKVDAQIIPVEDVADVIDWAENAKELSNGALERAIEEKPDSVSLKKALAWSVAVNKSITELPEEEIRPFPLAREALQLAHEKADVAIVSSANLGAVLDEWEKHALLEHTDIVMAQNAGSKAACIAALLEKGYDREKVLMCGDAPGDLAAAEKNGVGYFPILVNRERESWEEFMSEGFTRLLEGTYHGEYQDKKIKEFKNNLNK
jgi:phosphoglycolate phosphatase-like HAD superfamily hydrolase